MLRTVFVILALLAFRPDARAQQPDLTGHWVGTITQNEGGFRSEYSFELYLRQDGNGQITGRSYVFVEDIYAVFALEGRLRTNTLFNYEETEIVDSKKHENLEWCIKKAQLLIKIVGNEMRLEGYWQGISALGDCIPGRIVLKKQLPRS